ncbi:methylated-DNA--[protein]-cysteine S-methyltransferase [Mangrovimonas aestuarii]|uniref:methylated-DNA--[protein]-cysteine S-methyltransferase n=1 Tax=Mangrovimonas aestuarii TaxID=3018443 RepID=UPI002379450B|nr:methylated-DNA--[protein]-cysteine S-methyltransferase [Mangrovimonas aestuarii]
MNHCFVKTPLGVAKITGDSHGIESIKVFNDNEASPCNNIPTSLQEAVGQLEKYFNGDLQSFNLKLNPQGTTFQKKVWDALQNIPFGKTTSYAELATKLGDIKAIRAVAAANGKNPIWIVIPCHRVIGSDGSLTGYAGGLQLKEWLLNHESIAKQLRLF